MRNLTKNIGALYDKKCDITTVTLKKNIDLWPNPRLWNQLLMFPYYKRFATLPRMWNRF
jgi:hypothetical protein